MSDVGRSTSQPGPDGFDAEAAARDEFERGFRRSRKGYLWREYDGRILTVFRRRDGWSISRDDDPEFSPEAYPTEGGAVSALWDLLWG